MEDYNNVLECKTKDEFYEWLKKNHNKEDECYLECKKGKIKPNTDILYYIDAVYMALCFGWIDSSQKVIDGTRYQRFSPRKKNSHWSELNKARCKWLIKNKLMTKAGLDVLPDLDEELDIDKDILKTLKKDEEIWDNFNNFPELYRRLGLAIFKEKKRKVKLIIKH